MIQYIAHDVIDALRVTGSHTIEASASCLPAMPNGHRNEGGDVSPAFQTMAAPSGLSLCAMASCATRPGNRKKASILVVFMTTVFQETAEGVRDMLAGLDVDVDLHKPEPVGPGSNCAAVVYAPLSAAAAGYDVVVIIGAHMLPRRALPEFYIVFQMEQLTSRYMTPEYLSVLHGALQVWDFSPANVSTWRKLGLRAYTIPAYVARRKMTILERPLSPAATAHASSCGRPPGSLRGDVKAHTRGGQAGRVDILFYGLRNARRELVQARLAALCAQCGLTCLFYLDYSLWGAHRDAVVDNASVVLNMHFYEGASLEVHRINYLLGRQKCVVSERSVDDVLDSVYSGAVEFATFDQLPAVAVEMAMNALRRRELERAGAALMLRIHQDPSPLLKALIELGCTADETETGGGQSQCSCEAISNPQGMQALGTPERQMYGFSHASKAPAAGSSTSTLNATARSTHSIMLSADTEVRATPISAACDELRCQIDCVCGLGSIGCVGHAAYRHNVNTVSLPLLWAPATGFGSRKRSRVA